MDSTQPPELTGTDPPRPIFTRGQRNSFFILGNHLTGASLDSLSGRLDTGEAIVWDGYAPIPEGSTDQRLHVQGTPRRRTGDKGGGVDPGSVTVDVSNGAGPAPEQTTPCDYN